MRPICAGCAYNNEARRKVMQMIMGSNKRWSDLTARQKVPLVVQEIVQMTLLVAALTDIHRRPTEEIKGSKWVCSVVAFANFMGIGPIAYFAFERKHA
jgi:hypothetical protein